jgi:hypothetical protein
MAKKEAKVDPKKLSPDQLLQLLQLAGVWAPSIFAAFQKLVDILNQKQPMQVAGKVACPAACDCCDKAIDAQLQALAAVLECRCCCSPDEPEPVQPAEAAK